MLETFDEGEFLFANKVLFSRKYLTGAPNKDPTFFTHMTEIRLQAEQPKATICCFHGIAQCSDTFFEMGLHFALNGIRVLLVDFEGAGYTGGRRMCGLSIEALHAQISTLI